MFPEILLACAYVLHTHNPKAVFRDLEVTTDTRRTCSNNILAIFALGQCKKCANRSCMSAGFHCWNVL